MGGIEKPGRKNLRSLGDLGKHLPHAPAEPRPHSLSSAATGEMQGSAVSPEHIPDVETAVKAFFDAADENRDLEAVFHNQKEWLRSEYVPMFERRLREEAYSRGQELTLPDDQPAQAEASASSEPATATPITLATEEATPGAPDQSARGEPEEWIELIKKNRAGDGVVDNRFKYWIAPDGHAYIDRGDSRPRRVEHGGPIRFREKITKEMKTVYWDKDNHVFSVTNPAPELEAERNRLARAMSGQREYSPESRAAVQEKLRVALAARNMTDEDRTRILGDIAKITNYFDARRIGRVIGHRPVAGEAQVAQPANEVRRGRGITLGGNALPPETRVPGSAEDIEEAYRARREQPHDYEDVRRSATTAPAAESSPAQERSPAGPVLQNQEDLDGLLQRLAARHGAGAPPGQEAPLPKLESLQRHQSLPGYFVDRESGAIYTPEQAQDIFNTQAERRQRDLEAQRQQQAPIVAPQEALVAPQPLAAGVIPDFVARNRVLDGVERKTPLTFEQGPTMDLILADKKQQELFGELVKAHGSQELSARYMASSEHPESMQTSDYMELATHLDQFQHRMQLLEEVQRNFTQEDVTFMLVHNPAFAAVRTQLRPERAFEVMKQSLAYMFMRSSNTEINAMVLSQRANAVIRTSQHYLGLNERARERTGALGVKTEDINWNMLNPQLQRQILKPGFLAWAFGGENTRRSQSVLQHIQTNRAAMGMLLGSTISSDQSLLARIAREAQSAGEERVPQVGERGVATAAEERVERSRINQELNEQSLLNRVRSKDFRRDFRDAQGRAWADSTPDAREEAIFAPYEREARQKRSLLGWFANFLSSFFEVRVNRARHTLKAAGAFA